MKSSYLRHLLGFVLVFSFDQFTKLWGETLPTLYYNEGFIMGHFSGQPESIRVVALGCFAAILFAAYFLLITFLPARARLMRFSLTLLVAGLFGNVMDRLVLGKTRDFIPFSPGKLLYTFNFADVFIWSSTILILWIVFKKDYLLWHGENTRRKYLVNPPEQLAFAFQLTCLIFSACLLFGIFSFALIRTSVPEDIIRSIPFALALLSITIFLCFYGFLAGILISHRRLGPLYAFELFVTDLISGKSRPLRLREGDSYQHLAQTAEKLRDYVAGRTTSEK